jgi:hypothetical protein
MKPVPFWDVIRAMSDINAQYDVVMLPDGNFRADDLAAEQLDGYPLVIVPDCWVLTENQQQILLGYARQGGKVLAAGRLAEGTALADKLKETGNAVFVSLDGEKEEYIPRFMKAFEELYAAFAPVDCRLEKIGVQRYDNDGKTWIHLLNYQYDEQKDGVLPIEKLELTLRGVSGNTVEILVPAGDPVPAYELVQEAEITRMTLRNAGLYTVIAFV